MSIKLKLLFIMTAIISSNVNAALIGMSSDTDAVYEIDPIAGATTLLFNTTQNHAGIGLSFVGENLFASDALYHIGEPWDVRLVEIDTSTGVASAVNMQDGSLNWHGLASNQATQELYAIDINDNNILKATNMNGSVSSIGSTSIDGRGLAYDDNHSILYSTDSSGGLYTVNTNDGSSSLIGNLGVGSLSFVGLAYDENLDLLFANVVDGGTRLGSLYSIDVNSGLASLIGNNNDSFIDGIAWVPGEITTVPIPATAWLFGSGLFALIGVTRRKKYKNNHNVIFQG